MKDSTLRELAEKARDWKCTCEPEDGLHTEECLARLEQLEEESVLAILSLLERIEKLRAVLTHLPIHADYSADTINGLISDAIAADDKAQE
jgi:hypothetical protein